VTDGARTRDNRSHNPVLYQLSYGHQERGANMIGVPTKIKADFRSTAQRGVITVRPAPA
jgi:hypothetical protein